MEVREDLRVTFGPPDEALVTAAQEQQARLLVLGHVGRRLPARWLLGSVAESVARSAPVPVLTVRDSDPWVEWAEGRRPLRVVVGVEFSPASKAALSWAGSLARWGPCQLVVVHAYWPPEERQRRGLEGPSILGLNAAEVETPLTAELQAMLAECLPTPQESARLRVIASWGRIADDLVRAAEEEHADLVVVGAHRRGWAARLWYGSVSSGVLHLGHGTVAVVPGPVVPSTT